MKFGYIKLAVVALLITSIFSFIGCKKDVSALNLEGGNNKVIVVIGSKTITNGDIVEEANKLWKDYYTNRLSKREEPLTAEEIADEQKKLIDYVVDQKIVPTKIELFFEENPVAFEMKDAETLASDLIFTSMYSNLAELEEDYLSKKGMTLTAWLKQIKIGMTLNKYLCEKIIKTAETGEMEGIILPSDEDLKAKYESDKQKKYERPRLMNLSQIVVEYVDVKEETSEEGETVEAKGITKEDAKIKIDGIFSKLNKGADFEKLAKKNSDTWNEEKGAAFLEYFPQNGASMFSSENKKLLEGLSADEYSEVITNESSKYFAIYKADKVVDAATKSFDDVAENVKTDWILAKNGQIAQKFYEEIVNAYKVEYVSKEEVPEATDADATKAKTTDADATKAKTTDADATDDGSAEK